MTPAKTTTQPGVASNGPLMSDLMRFGVCFAPETGDGGGGYEEPEREVEDSEYLDEDAGDDAFLTNLTGADEATQESDGGEDADANTGASDQSEEGDTVRTEAPTDTKTDDAKKPAVGDDAIVEVKVGEEVQKVTIGSLKRLHGQEAALTRRSQEVAAARTEVLAQAEHAKTVLTKAIERAEAKYKPYAEMDFFKQSRELDAETFDQLRADARAAYEELAFLKEEAAAVDKTVSANAAAVSRERAQACVAEITKADSPHYIAGWNGKLYGELLEYASTQGFKAAANIVDPAAIKLLHKAMLFDRGAKVASEKVKKVAEQPRRPMRPGAAGSSTASRRSAEDATLRLRRSGSADDAEAAFMARLRGSDD